jgi:hypothetical protein
MMTLTPKQEERLRNKIKKIKAGLAADKRLWGGHYHDGAGLRYAPPQLYIKLNDFAGGLRYFTWFSKTFSDDVCYPEFLLEWTIVLFKSSRLKEAEKKAFETYCSKIDLFDVYFGRLSTIEKKKEDYPITKKKQDIHQLAYSYNQDHLIDFSAWLAHFIASDKFIQLSNKFKKINQQIELENNQTKIRFLLDSLDQLVHEL